jgi:hypothetical protein
VIDASEKSRLAKKIKDILGDPKADTDKYNQVLGFLLDSYKLTPDIHSKRENLDYSFKHYSDGLVASVNQLEITPYRLKLMVLQVVERHCWRQMPSIKASGQAATRYIYATTGHLLTMSGKAFLSLERCSPGLALSMPI